MLQLDNPFWQFSLKVYATPGVADQCLALQRALSIDVNIVLFCAWAGAVQRVVLTATDFQSIHGAIGTWHDTAVRPLRAVRESIKPLPEMAHDEVKALRKQIAASELRAEQIEQALLHGWAQALPTRESHLPLHDLVRGNIEAFLKHQRYGKGSADALAATALIDAALRFAGH